MMSISFPNAPLNPPSSPFGFANRVIGVPPRTGVSLVMWVRPVRKDAGSIGENEIGDEPPLMMSTILERLMSAMINPRMLRSQKLLCPDLA